MLGLKRFLNIDQIGLWVAVSSMFVFINVSSFSFPIRRKIVVAKQNYRCAGCGTRIDPGIASKSLFQCVSINVQFRFLAQLQLRLLFFYEEVQLLVPDTLLFQILTPTLPATLLPLRRLHQATALL